MGAIRALIIKDLRLLARDRGAVFLTFAWPLLLAIFFGALGFGGGTTEGERRMTVLVIDDDRSEASEALLERLDANPRMQIEIASLADARERVRTGASAAYVRVPDGFGDAPSLLFDPVAAATGGRHVEIGVDPRRRAEAELLAAAANLAAWQALARELPGAARDPEAITIDYHSIEPAHVHVARPPSPYAVTFPQGMIWAVLACAATFAVSLVDEHKRGTLLRLAIAPVSRLTILAGKAGACLVAIGITQLVLLLVAVLGFGVRPQSPALLALALACTAIGFVGVMTLLAVLGRRTQSAAGLSWAVLMLMAMLGGGMLPLFMMPSWLQSLATASPVAWALTAIEGAVWRGFSLAELALPCVALLVLGVGCLAIGTRAVREL
jgi:ABC-2 type transport system permease protein